MILFDEVSQFLVMAKIPVDPLSPKVISRMYLTTARWTVEKGALLGAQSFFFFKKWANMSLSKNGAFPKVPQWET